jgi:ribosomal protein S12 methylthiotransferase
LGKRIHFVPLGCAKNQVDGELMLGRAIAEGHEIVGDAESADVLVVNTCAFIEDARKESVGKILELAALRSADRKLVVTGCMAERYGSELAREIPEIDAMVGTGALDRFTEALDADGGAIFRAGPHYLPSARMERVVADTDGSAYLKVSEGCDHDCAFCVIPDIRGRHASRPLEDVVAEAQRLAERGIVEVNLVAQDLSAYGRDLGQRDGLAALLRALGEVRGLERVRCLYLYPNTLADSALAAMAEVGNVCPYIDMPLQHADETMLRSMRRGGTRDSLRRLLDRIRGKLGDPVVRSTFIVGFPGRRRQPGGDLARPRSRSRRRVSARLLARHPRGDRRRSRVAFRRQDRTCSRLRSRHQRRVDGAYDGPSPRYRWADLARRFRRRARARTHDRRRDHGRRCVRSLRLADFSWLRD